LEAGRVTLKLLITGASGLYGSKLAKIAIERGIEVYSSDIQDTSIFGNFVKLDISAKAQVDEVFGAIKPDVVVHAATLTDVDKCELNKDLAWKVNVDGTKNMRRQLNASGLFLFTFLLITFSAANKVTMWNRILLNLLIITV
jgi:dTDP-4-dehydrorhamnose reductase